MTDPRVHMLTGPRNTPFLLVCADDEPEARTATSAWFEENILLGRAPEITGLDEGHWRWAPVPGEPDLRGLFRAAEPGPDTVHGYRVRWVPFI